MRIITQLIRACIFCCLLAQGALAQTAFVQSFNAGNFEQSVEEARKVLGENENDPAANFYTGASLVRLERYAEAEKFLIAARTNSFQPAVAVGANLLRTFAGQKKTNQLFAELDSLTASGFRGLRTLQSAEFDYLRDSDRFVQAEEAVYANAFPCTSDDRYKKLDFWVGAWNIYDRNENLIAHSNISKREGGCTVFEDYRTLTGFVGSSINYFDDADEMQKQIWIDLNNSITRYQEVASDRDSLIMLAQRDSVNFNRMVFVHSANGDTVRQTFQNSPDAGKTWTNGFFGKYVRQTKASVGSELREVLSKMEALFQEDNMAEIADFYTSDAVIYGPGGRTYEGIDAVRAYWQSLKGKGVSWTNTVEAVHLDDGQVTSLSTSDLKHVFNGSQVTSLTKALVIWKRVGGEYKIHRDFYQMMR